MAETLDRPTTVEGEYSCWLPRHRRSPGVARLLLRTFLGGFEDGERFTEVGELLLSELVTNAVEHARVPAGRLVKVRFALEADRLRVEVHDASPQRPVPGPAPARPDAEAGRGLLLVRELSDGWGCCPRAGGIGKFVWFECTPAGPPGAGAGTSATDAAMTPAGPGTA
ncbi:ATP-binding protein [Streptomyces sp. CB03911]|uniref:ATP-binding protein n=1 Tax=Streptomyces sp. CB03911 TaxID=1804758 RepID=UPI00093EB848|nr:ATP-binding protein [Streptomyces sp. CB03911]